MGFIGLCSYYDVTIRIKGDMVLQYGVIGFGLRVDRGY
uniref:Uncharacterized protein n=1 Tax=Arundo donax TaxID=35708 RepID=A0A0A9HIP3_ARUDO